jgi:GWxTD domain-containing protein
MHRLAVGMAVVGALAGCGNWKRVGSDDPLSPSETLTQLFNLQAYYQRLGRLAAGDPLPFVGTVAFAAGQGDTVIAVLGLSLENRALSFQKEGTSFTARYRVDVSLQQPGGAAPIQVGQDEVVRVPSFQETLRNDESVLFQKSFRVLPGTYHVVVTLRDPSTNNQSKAEADFTAPDFQPGSTTVPILAYQATGRGSAAENLSVVLNPRGSVAFGGDTLLAYIEGYGFAGPTRVPFEVRTEQDSVVYGDSLLFRGGRAVESQVIRLRPDSMALGELKLSVGQGPARREVSALVSFSTAWVVTNFDEMVSLLRYFGEDQRLAELRKAPPGDRPRLWREFWKATDPNPVTPDNEALNTYFTRLGLANTRFRDEGMPGWRTDRGEVFINIGDPDESYDASPASQGRVIRWTYISLGLNLFFADETGFGRFRLTPSSRAEFERTVSRLRRQAT